jgi:hypothetical protein
MLPTTLNMESSKISQPASGAKILCGHQAVHVNHGVTTTVQTPHWFDEARTSWEQSLSPVYMP